MDITKCSGGNCPLKEKCKRFTAKDSKQMKSLMPAPFKINKGMFECDLFWGEQSGYLLEMLKSILKGEKHKN